MNKLMMKLTIGSEAIFFTCLIVAYLYFARTTNFQQEVSAHLHTGTTALFTVALLLSSLSFWFAERNHTREKRSATKIWLTVTIILGTIFLAGQAHEYYQLMKENITISKSEFGSSFYTLTGFHGLHVLIGLLILIIILVLIMQGHLRQQSSSVLRTVGIYWHFVDVVWIFVFTTVYLLPHLL